MAGRFTSGIGKKKNPYFSPALIKKDFSANYVLYLMALPVLVYFVLFNYQPMYGAIIAFKRFMPARGILGSPWVGLDNFANFFTSYYCWRVIRNTLLINIYSLIFYFPAPILLAFLLNEMYCLKYKRVVQTISYLPHFVSVVVIAGLIRNFCAYDGVISTMITWFGGQRSNLLANQRYFRTIYISSEIWQGVGFGSIIYLAALTGINPDLYEAARIDGAGRLKQALNITLPSVLPTVVIMLILRMGQMMNVGFEKIVLIYNSMTYETADVISSFVFRKGLLEADYSYSTAVGMFNSVINFLLLVTANAVSRRVNETSLW